MGCRCTAFSRKRPSGARASAARPVNQALASRGSVGARSSRQAITSRATHQAECRARHQLARTGPRNVSALKRGWKRVDLTPRFTSGFLKRRLGSGLFRTLLRRLFGAQRWRRIAATVLLGPRSVNRNIRGVLQSTQLGNCNSTFYVQSLNSDKTLISDRTLSCPANRRATSCVATATARNIGAELRGASRPAFRGRRGDAQRVHDAKRLASNSLCEHRERASVPAQSTAAQLIAAQGVRESTIAVPGDCRDLDRAL